MNQSDLFLKRQIHKPCYESKYAASHRWHALFFLQAPRTFAFFPVQEKGSVQKNLWHVLAIWGLGWCHFKYVYVSLGAAFGSLLGGGLKPHHRGCQFSFSLSAFLHVAASYRGSYFSAFRFARAAGAGAGSAFCLGVLVQVNGSSKV